MVFIIFMGARGTGVFPGVDNEGSRVLRQSPGGDLGAKLTTFYQNNAQILHILRL